MQQALIDANNAEVARLNKALRLQLDNAKLRLGTDPAGCTGLDCRLGDLSALFDRLADAQAALIEINRANAKSVNTLIGLQNTAIGELQSGTRSAGEAPWLAKLFGAQYKGGVDYQRAVVQAQAAARAISDAANFDFAGLLKQQGLMVDGVAGSAESFTANVLSSLSKAHISDPGAELGELLKAEIRSQISGNIAAQINDRIAQGILPRDRRGPEAQALQTASSKMSSALSETLVENTYQALKQTLKAGGKTLKSASHAELRAALGPSLKQGFQLKPEAVNNIVGQAVLAAGNVLADASQKQELDRLKGLQAQLSDADRERLRLIRAWRGIMRLNKQLKASITSTEDEKQHYANVAAACKATRKKLPSCLERLRTRLAGQQAKLEKELEPLSKTLKVKKQAYEAAMEKYQLRLGKRNYLLDELGRLGDQLKAARKQGKDTVALKRRFDLTNEELTDFTMEPEQTRLSMARSEMDGIWLARKHAAERHAMSMRFAVQDAQKEVAACLNESATPSAGNTRRTAEGADVDKPDFDLNPAYAVVTGIQQQLIDALKKARIEAVGGEKCPKPDKSQGVTPAPAPAPVPAPVVRSAPKESPGVPIDPAFAGLYTTSDGELLINITVDGPRMRGEVVDTCDAMQKWGGLNYQPGDTYLEGKGVSRDEIKGRLHLKLTSRIAMQPGSEPMACAWNSNLDVWPDAEFYSKPHAHIFMINARYTMRQSYIECGTAQREIDGLMMTRPLKIVQGFTPQESFRSSCAEFSTRAPAAEKMEVFIPPVPPQMEPQGWETEPLLEPEPMLEPEKPVLVPAP
jgi:hypothetical protein